jgi:hypothetical protein
VQEFANLFHTRSRPIALLDRSSSVSFLFQQLTPDIHSNRTDDQSSAAQGTRLMTVINSQLLLKPEVRLLNSHISIPLPVVVRTAPWPPITRLRHDSLTFAGCDRHGQSRLFVSFMGNNPGLSLYVGRSMIEWCRSAKFETVAPPIVTRCAFAQQSGIELHYEFLTII